eukprot:CAMPEP_0116910576 /NCGR_PEP_ID=MMETSP0467-20121206/14962_1 /TAXON_ID=283647 /ORGANISM="Mesodinium pulex, Strain SPMC105" /LENGTH=136 /DNA_ID=CAMNT_0004586169 /DNA_START=946 /DNA_END=1352 /DNA_ORIENTATION=+
MRTKWNGDSLKVFNHVNLTLHNKQQFRVAQQAEALQLTGLSHLMDNLGEVKLAELLHGTISVRLGASGYETCINGESAFINVSEIQDRLIFKDGNATNSKFVDVYTTFDHRTVDGAEGAAFLVSVKKSIENPMELL